MNHDNRITQLIAKMRTAKTPAEANAAQVEAINLVFATLQGIKDPKEQAKKMKEYDDKIKKARKAS